jgi:hypothetical protein
LEPPAGLLHQRCTGLDGTQRGGHVDLEDLVRLVGVDLGEHIERVGPDEVHQHVQPVSLFSDRGDGGVALALVHRVELDEVRRAPGIVDLPN